MDTHACPIHGCDRTDVPDTMLMCARDWYKVPKALRRAVYRAYDHGAGVGTPALRAAQQAAIRAVERGQ